MKITFLGTTSSKGQCPTLYATDRGTYIAQGKIVTDPEALKTVRETYAGLGDDETMVEIPAELFRFAPKAAECPLI
ncbi:MAG: hypothetical protein JOZ47_19935 [Kutzneria sp.]|nr:hypothetical protein [Kutzneria sp.]MBV9847315.1 hypothetical protein [Kutzneria sp.]